MQMLLFYGSNSHKQSALSSSQINHASKSPSKQRNLEERLGSATKSQSSSTSRRPFAPRQSLAAQRTKALFLSLQDPSSHFPDDQQFFFRFLLIMDSYRFNMRLRDVLSAELVRLSNEYSNILSSSGLTMKDNIVNNSSTPNRHCSPSKTTNISIVPNVENNNYRTSFVLRVKKLKIIGKFLGLLYFSPYWTVSISALTEGPIVKMMHAASAQRDIFRINGMSLTQILRNASSEKRLCIVVPWVVNFLRMMFWDKSSVDALMNVGTHLHDTIHLSNHYCAVFEILASTYQNPMFTLQQGLISRNRFEFLEFHLKKYSNNDYFFYNILGYMFYWKFKIFSARIPI
jgi:hypothetical protein